MVAINVVNLLELPRLPRMSPEVASRPVRTGPGGVPASKQQRPLSTRPRKTKSCNDSGDRASYDQQVIAEFRHARRWRCDGRPG